MSEDRPFPTDRLSSLESTVDNMMSQSEATKNLLQTILKRLGPVPGLLNESRLSPTGWPQSRPPTPIPTPGSERKKTLLKPSAPSEFDGDHVKGKAFLTSCWTYICLCPETFEDDTVKIVWVMSYMKSGRAGHWAAREFDYEAASRDGRLRFLDWVDFEDEFCKDFLQNGGMNGRLRRRMPNELTPVTPARFRPLWRTQMMRTTNSSQILRAPQRNNLKKAIRFGPLDSSRNLNISGHPLQFPSGSPNPSNRTPN
jgi:hypothetical protein